MDAWMGIRGEASHMAVTGVIFVFRWVRNIKISDEQYICIGLPEFCRGQLTCWQKL